MGMVASIGDSMADDEYKYKTSRDVVDPFFTSIITLQHQPDTSQQAKQPSQANHFFTTSISTRLLSKPSTCVPSSLSSVRPWLLLLPWSIPALAVAPPLTQARLIS
jgi:hypothetical protein